MPAKVLGLRVAISLLPSFPYRSLPRAAITAPCPQAWRNGRRTGLSGLSAPRETAGVELPKFGETFTGNPEPSPAMGRCRD